MGLRTSFEQVFNQVKEYLFPPVAVTGNTTVKREWFQCNVLVSAASAITLPSNADLSVPTGFTFYIYRGTSGAVTFVAGSGATVASTEGATVRIAAEEGWAAVTKVATNKWSVTGKIEAYTP